MRKHHENRCLLALKLVLLIFISTSCVNYIEEEDDDPTSDVIPIKISSQIKTSYTRVVDNEFTTADAIGLYLLPETKSLGGKRYVDNMRFVCEDGAFVPDQPIFYPTASGKYDFISYYPYRENAILFYENTMMVSVGDNQNNLEVYNSSDLLIAKSMGVVPSGESVELRHEHKMCQLTFVIQLSAEDDIDALKHSSSIIVHNTYTQATYNFEEGTFTDLDTPKDIVPYGEWEADKVAHRLTGKRLLLIPQKNEEGRLTLKIEGREFSVMLPSDIEISSGTRCELTLHYSSQVGIKGISPSIEEWKDGSKSDVIVGADLGTVLSISSLNFEESNVYQVVNQSDVVLAEICQEYLLNSSIDAQAIVLYPTGSAKGTVLRLLDVVGAVHGGEVLWNKETNTFTYEAGASYYMDNLYLSEAGELSFIRPSNCRLLYAKPFILNDVRGGEKMTYPIVKIGAQYWMRENLKSTKYRDGTALKQILDLKKTAAGFYVNETNLYYNTLALANNKLAPTNWSIPSKSDWLKLEKYVGNSVSKLKAGTQWLESEGVKQASNLSYFRAYPIGFFYQTKSITSSIYDYNYKYSAYWYQESSPVLSPLGGLSLAYSGDSLSTIKESDFGGYTIRCLRD